MYIRHVINEDRWEVNHSIRKTGFFIGENECVLAMIFSLAYLKKKNTA